MFEIGVEHTHSFKYIGLQLHKNTNSICIDQVSYAKGIQQTFISKERLSREKDPLSPKETKELRVLIGQLNWLAMQTRLDILFQCCELINKIKSATVEDLVQANKVLKQAKKKKIILKFRKLEDVEKC